MSHKTSFRLCIGYFCKTKALYIVLKSLNECILLGFENVRAQKIQGEDTRKDNSYEMENAESCA